MKTKISILLLISTIFLTSGFGCRYVSQEVKEKMKNVELNYWRVWDGPDVFNEIIAKYTQLHPFVKINYTKLRYEEFEEKLKKLTKQNNKGQIIQSGIALGGAYNIERNTDILSVLMMQNGTEMMEDGIVKFNQKLTGKDYNPGSDALRFYMDFANPAKEIYRWNKTLDNSIDMFVQNKLAMMYKHINR